MPDKFIQRGDRLRDQLLRSAFGLSIVVAAAASSGRAEASCAPGATAGDDVIVCVAAGSNPLFVSGLSGNDQITNNGETITSVILGADGNDVLTQTAGSVNAGMYGGTGADTLVLSGGNVNVALGGGDGNDWVTVSGGSGAFFVGGNDGDDTLEVSGGIVSLGVNGHDDNDTLTITGGVIGVGVAGEDGDDVIEVGGTAVIAGFVAGGSGADTMAVSGGSGAYLLSGNAGSDTITVSGGEIDLGMEGGDDSDTLTVTGGIIGVGVDGDEGDDTLSVGGTAVINGLIAGSEGNDSLELTGDAVANFGILGGTGDDTIFISGGTLEIGASGDLLGPSGDDGNDVILMSAGQVNGALAGFNGNDTFVVSGGTVDGILDVAIDAGDGADTIAISGTAYLGDTVTGRSGDDSIVMSGGTVDSSIFGELGLDYMALSGGQVTGDVYGNEGADTIDLSGVTVDGTLSGGDDGDSLSLTGGLLSGDLLGEAGADTITIDGTGTLGGNLLAGDDGDSIDLVAAASVTGTISGGAGDDTVVVRDFFSTLSAVDLLEGGDGTDNITFRQMVGQLGSGFEGFETIVLDNAGLDVFDGTNDLRVIQADGGNPTAVGLIVGSGLFARGNSPGVLSIVGSLGNDVSALDMQDGAADDLVRISQDYAGANGAQLRIDAALDATNIGDVLEIQGSITSVTVGALNFVDGTTLLVVNDIGTGQGVLTGTGPGAGIRVVDVSATGNTDPTDFVLDGGPIQAGAVEYDLVLESDSIWYLQSALLAQIAGYAASPSAAVAMGQEYLASLRERVGTREQTWTGGAVQSSEGTGVWLRGGGNFTEVSDADGFDYDQDHWFAQAGADFPLLLDPNGPRLIGGLFAHYGTSDIQADEAKGTLDAWGGGLSLTWYGAPKGAEGLGLYADLVGQVSMYDAEVKADGAEGSTDGWGFGVSLEAGWGFELAKNLRLIPQAQLSYSRVDLDDFTDSDGVEVEYGAADSLEGRVGFAVDSGRLWRSGNITFDANIVHEFLGESEADAEGIDIGTDLQGTAAEVGLGGTVSLLDNVSVYADVDYRIPLSEEGREGVSANLGLRVSW